MKKVVIAQQAPSNQVDYEPSDMSQLHQVICPGQSYETEWKKLCESTQVSLEGLISLALTGQLRVCRFRSICWLLFLKVLHGDHLQVSLLIYS